MKWIPNKSWTYALPMLGKHKEEFSHKQLFPLTNFRGCFLQDENCPELNTSIFLLYRFSSSDIYLRYEERLLSHKNFNLMYEPDKYHTMYVFDVADKYLDDYGLLMDSKYSKMSPTYKAHVLKFHNLTKKGQVHGVLYKTEERFQKLERDLNISIPREQEASSILDMNKESFKTNLLPESNAMEKAGRNF